MENFIGGTNIQKKRMIFKDTFAVIGKMGEGSADSAHNWIPSLWDSAGTYFPEIQHLLPKDTNGASIELWWGLMNDINETNTRWGEIGKYMTGCEVALDVQPPEGWTKWVIPAQTYLVVRATPETTGEIFGKSLYESDAECVGLGHEHYPEPGNDNVVDVYIPIIKGNTI